MRRNTENRTQLTAVPGSLFMGEDVTKSANEQWARLHSDPLLQIRQQEQAALKSIKQVCFV